MHAMRVYNLDQPHLDIYRPIDSGCPIRTLENLTNITTALAQVSLYLSVITDRYFPSSTSVTPLKPLILGYGRMIMTLTTTMASMLIPTQQPLHANLGADTNTKTNMPIVFEVKKNKSRSQPKGGGRSTTKDESDRSVDRVRGGTLAMLVWRNGTIYFSLVFGSEITCVISSAVWGFQKDDHRVCCLGALQNVVIEHIKLNLVIAARNPETEMLQKLTSLARSNVIYIPPVLVPVW